MNGVMAIVINNVDIKPMEVSKTMKDIIKQIVDITEPIINIHRGLWMATFNGISLSKTKLSLDLI